MFSFFDIIDQLRVLTIAKAYKAPQYGINDYDDGFVTTIKNNSLRPYLNVDHPIKLAVVSPTNKHIDLLKGDGYKVFVNNWGSIDSCSLDFVRNICNTLQIYWRVNADQLNFNFEYPWVYDSSVESLYYFCKKYNLILDPDRLYVVGRLYRGNSKKYTMIGVIVQFSIEDGVCIINHMIVHPGLSIDSVKLVESFKQFISQSYNQLLTFKIV